MNNVEKLNELRAIAVRRGFSQDRNFYVPVRQRNDGRAFMPGNGENALLFDSDWIRSLVGDGDRETEWIDGKTLETVMLPAHEAMMMELAQIQAKKGDTVGHLHNAVKKEDRP